MAVNQSRAEGQWQDALSQMKDLITVTANGDLAILTESLNTQDFILTCLVTAFLANRCGKRAKETMTLDDMVSTGGLIYRPAKQTLYNNLSMVSKAAVVRKRHNEFYLEERAVLQFIAKKLPKLLAANPNGALGDGERRRAKLK